jgi:hypothetical protein
MIFGVSLRGFQQQVQHTFFNGTSFVKLHKLGILVENFNINPFVPVVIEFTTAWGDTKVTSARRIQNFRLDKITFSPGDAIIKLSLGSTREKLPCPPQTKP